MKENSESNSAAKVSAILAALFLTLACSILAAFEAKLCHPEIVFLSMPVTFGMGLIASVLGSRGLRAAKRHPDGSGRGEAMVGCVGGLATAAVAVVTFFVWGGTFRQ